MTVTVDGDVFEAGHRAVAAGLAASLSAWVNEALLARTARDRRLRALGEAISQYESKQGEISLGEMEAQQRGDRAGAVVVRGRGRQAPPAGSPDRRGAA